MAKQRSALVRGRAWVRVRDGFQVRVRDRVRAWVRVRDRFQVGVRDRVRAWVRSFA